MAFGRRLSGMGTPALAHMAAALAFAISSNWSLSKERERWGRGNAIMHREDKWREIRKD